MKSLSKKAIVISIVTLITVPSVAFAGWNYTHPANEQEVKNTVASQEVNTQQSAPIAEDTETTPTTTIEPTPAPIVVTPVPAPAQVILSTQEYANMYLKMTKAYETDRNTPQECLDAIIKLWPNRFSEGVREKNIKSLRFYERAGHTICTSGIIEVTNHRSSPYTATITIYGWNGEFFDSSIAQQYQY